MSQSLKLRKKVFFIIIGIFVSIILIEGVGQVWWFQIENCDFEKSDIFSDINLEMKKQVCVESFQFKTSKNVNNQENIDEKNYKQFGKLSIPIEKSENTYRIFILGGEISQERNSSDETIPQILKEKFSGFELNIEIFNMAKAGSWSRVESNLIESNLLQFKPDLFVIYNGHMDASSHGEWTEPIQVEERWDESTDNSQKVIQNWIDRWKNVCEIGKQENFDTIIAIQPMIGSSDRKISENEKKYFEEIKDQNYLKRLEMYSNALIHLDGSCSQTIDLRHSFDRIDEQIYTTSKGGLGSLGKNIIAEKLYEKILPIIKKSFPEIKQNVIENTDANNSSITTNDFFQNAKKSVLKLFKSPYMLFHFINSNEIIEQKYEENHKYGNLFYADLKNQNLENYDFSDIVVLSVDFQGANLQNTNFSGQDLRRSFFISSDISNSNFQYTHIEPKYFKNVIFIGADFSNSIFVDRGNMTNQNFTDVNFTNTVLLQNDLSNSILTRTDFSNSILTNVNFENSNLEDALGGPFIGCKNHILCE